MGVGTILVIAGVVVAALGGALAQFGWTLNQREASRFDQAFALSIPPALEVTAPYNDGIQSLRLENNGQHDVIAVEVFGVTYTIENGKVLQRSCPSQGIKIKEIATRKAEEIEPSNVFFVPPDPLLDDKGTHQMAIAIVTVFRRKDDNRRFVDVVPFAAGEINGHWELFSLYAGRGASSGGNPETTANLVRDLVEREKLLFHAE